MIGFIVFGSLFIVIGAFLVAAPNTVNRLDNAKRRAVLGDEVSPLKNRPVGQRIAGMVPIIAGIMIIIIGVTRH